MVYKYFALWEDLDSIYITDYDIYIYLWIYIYIYAGNGIMSNTVFRRYKWYIYVLKAWVYDSCTIAMVMICFLRHVCIMCYLKLYDELY